MGSDHDVFFESTWSIPGLYLHDWPDRYIHTNFDTAANIDPTKLKRAAFIGAVSGWYLANLSEDDVPALLDLLRRNALQRGSVLLERRASLPALDAAASTEVHFAVERRKVDSIAGFAGLTDVQRDSALRFLDELQKLFVMPVPAIFEPRSWSLRKNVFQERLGAAFDHADRVIVARVYGEQAVSEDERLDPRRQAGLPQVLRAHRSDASRRGLPAHARRAFPSHHTAPQ